MRQVYPRWRVLHHRHLVQTDLRHSERGERPLNRLQCRGQPRSGQPAAYATQRFGHQSPVGPHGDAHERRHGDAIASGTVPAPHAGDLASHTQSWLHPDGLDIRRFFNIYMDSDHTVAAMFVPTSPASAPPTPTPPAPAPSFADVPTSYWAYTSIAQFAQRGITTGCDTGLYCPDRNVTRAEMAVFLDRALGHASPPPPTTPTFADVPQGYWAYAYIEEFAQLGITTGCGTNDAGQRLFCPDRNVTRAEMAVFLDRAKGYGNPTAPASATFSDVPASYWAYVSVEQFAQLGITTGCGTDAQGRRLYCPDRNVTRAEMAVFVIRAFP
jgi:hypothetical protein